MNIAIILAGSIGARLGKGIPKQFVKVLDKPRVFAQCGGVKCYYTSRPTISCKYPNDYNTADGIAVRDFIHVVDLTKGHLKALEHIEDNGIGIFNLGTGKGTSVLELVTTFEKVNGLNLPYSFENRREGDIPVCYADCSRANEELDWKAELTIEDMCRDVWRWEQKEREE